ncbi:MAG: type II toxin-antitoxin system VapC family toxin [Deltaproteobacteria bacterium]|nr:type II toxin-antitoxin system VapC family toxin [Deltaproteobacteria bacterium]
MREIIIDANVLLSFVTDRHPEQQAKAAALFQSAGSSRTVIICPQQVITEFVYVLDKVYGLPKAGIRAMVADLLALPGFQVAHELDFAWVLAYWPDQIADYGDALLAATGKGRKGAWIATFDKKLINSLQKVGVHIFSW